MLRRCFRRAWHLTQYRYSLSEILRDLPMQTAEHVEPKRYRFLIVDPNLRSLEKEVNSFVASNPGYSVTQVVSVAGSGFLVVLEGGAESTK